MSGNRECRSVLGAFDGECRVFLHQEVDVDRDPPHRNDEQDDVHEGLHAWADDG